ncbi:MAG: TetR/AcrR family transcriptional regulator [Lachnospiraceae bacterium]|nr:TetR/AcrR family transcriptional regulator [Lachnospiraceae bacterium]
MARKELITKDRILNTAFELARVDGIESVTARKLAAQIGCSTQPIFRVYSNMSELYTEIYERAIDSFGDYYENFKSDVETPFIHLGLVYINYAKDEKKLFQLLFQSEGRGERSLYELLNGKVGAVSKEINRAAAAGCKNPSGLFMKIWIFIHGCACMVLTGDYDLTEEETAELLSDIYKSCS